MCITKKEMNNQRLSIIMPVFNHSDLVIEMIASIQANSYVDWELLAIDDGSTEEHYLRISEYVASDSRVTYERRTEMPKGAPTCRNVGFNKAHGEFVCFFDSDDYITPSCLQQRIGELEQHPELDFMVFRSTIYGCKTISVKEYNSLFGYNIYEDDIKAFCARTLPFVVCCNIYRRQSLIDHKIMWDTSLRSLQDAQFNISCLLSGMKYAYSVAPADYAYRINTAGSVSKRIYTKEHFESNIHAVESFYQIVQKHYGNKYNAALYDGAMFVNLTVARENFSMEFSMQLAKVIRKYSFCHGLYFMLQVLMTWLLMKILPYKVARQIPMFPYLHRARKHQWEWLPKQIGKLVSFLALLFAMFPIVSCSQSTASRDDQYELSWQDEFNEKDLNENIWSKTLRDNNARSAKHFTSDSRFFELREGRLRLYAKCNNGLLPKDTAEYLTSGITSEGKKTFTYGKIEARVRVHGAIGTWPAVWTMPEERKYWQHDSPFYTEIDIFEYIDRNNYVHQTVHNAYTLKSWKNWKNPPKTTQSKIKTNEYNIYTVEILPDKLIYSINGKETFRYPRRKDIEHQYHYGIKSHLLLTMQVDPPEGWKTDLRPKTFPAYMDIDWIRVYNLKTSNNI